MRCKAITNNHNHIFGMGVRRSYICSALFAKRLFCRLFRRSGAGPSNILLLPSHHTLRPVRLTPLPATAANDQVMLHTLLPELVEHIASHLDPLDLFVLRLTCRRLYLTSSSTFLATWFRVVYTDLSPSSLRRLNNIAHNERLATSVRRLCIGERHGWAGHAIGRGNHWPRLKSGNLDVSSLIVKEFHQVVARLTKCTGVTVTDELGDRPYLNGTDTSLSPADTMQLFLSAIAAGSFAQIQSFCIHCNRGSIAYMNPSQLSPGTITTVAFSTAWSSHLQDLELRWRVEDDTVWEMAIDLVTTATHLRVLALHWQYSKASDQCLRLLADAKLPGGVEHLKLSALGEVAHTTLCDFLARFKTSLKSLRIDFVKMKSMEWGSAFENMQRQPFSQLESLTVGWCHAYLGPNNGAYLFFCPLGMRVDEAERDCGGKFEFTGKGTMGPNRHICRINGVRYRGTVTGMQRALKYLEESAYALAYRSLEDPGYPDMRSKVMIGPDGSRVERFEDKELWDASRHSPR